VYYHTARNAGTFATEQMFLTLHWQVTDLRRDKVNKRFLISTEHIAVCFICSQ